MSMTTFITSGKGGVGKSTICALLGATLANMGKKTLLIELDCGLRSLDIMLGIQDNSIFDLNDILMGNCSNDKAILTCSYCDNLHLISSPIDSKIVLDQNYFKNFLNSISSSYEHILIDSPAGLNLNFKSTLSLIDNALIIVTPDPICVRDACKVSQIISDYGIKSQRLIINKVKNKYSKLNILPDLDYIIDNVGVRLISVIPDDISIMKSVFNGNPLPKNSISHIIFNNLANRIIGNEVPLLLR